MIIESTDFSGVSRLNSDEGREFINRQSLGQGRTPEEVHAMRSEADIKNQFSRMYKNAFPTTNRVTSSLNIGDTIRIADGNRNAVFRRGYTVQNTLEMFKIKKLVTLQNPTAYILEDLAGEEIKGTFYREELIPTELPETYDITILDRRRRGSKTQYYVNWKGYPAQFNSRVDESQIVRT
ncbi:uncharacterized protein [Macrobrachium rosenbergii]|uniref:uncharacterized protein n=1 Tax=Macrobrachium rosenbergii TaxID=79674 RepID=UPI0034D4B2A4